ncbi:MAG: efflux RND transporter periplasmic adaptor subunit [Planctomycetaceae bacterium]
MSRMTETLYSRSLPCEPQPARRARPVRPARSVLRCPAAARGGDWLSVGLIVLSLSLLSATTLQAQVTQSFIEPFETIDVAAADAGIVRELLVREGQHVSQGDVIARLDTLVLEATRKLAKLRASSTARIEAARVDVKLKERQKQKLSLVLANGHANSNEIEKAEAEYDAAVAALKLAEEETAINLVEVERIDAEIERRMVRSPVDGVVTRLHQRVGEYLPLSEPVLATVVRLDQLRVKFYITTEMAEQLKPGASLTVVVGPKSEELPAQLDFLSPVTDADSGTVRIEVLIDNAGGQLRSGIPCRLKLP